MTALPETTLMTGEEFLGLPLKEEFDRELIRGVLKEKPMTRRNKFHGATEISVGAALHNWVRAQPRPRGRVYGGEIGVRLRRNPDTIVGIDVAYFSAEAVEANRSSKKVLDGAPVLAVEILSPSDQQEDILDKVEAYLNAGTLLVWVIEPVFKTVMVYRAGLPPQGLNVTQELSGEPHLPGFKVAIAELLED